MFETVSAAVDDEANKFELHRMFDEAERDPRVRDAWTRFHAVSAAVRGEWRTGGDALRARVWKAVQTDLAPGEDCERGNADSNPCWGRLAAVAVAAGVAVAVVVTMSAPGDSVDGGVSRHAQQVISQAAAPRLVLQNEISPADLERLNKYMMHHVQHKAMYRPDVSSFAKFVTYAQIKEENR